MAPPPATLNPEAVALFLDVDGTLLEIRDTPSAVVADQALLDLLSECRERLDGALCLVSGRSIAEVDRIMAPAVFPAAGAHGAELRVRNGQMPADAVAPFPDKVVKALRSFVERYDGLLLERKHGGVSLHYRKAPALESECRRVVMSLMPELGDDYRVIAGKMVFEIAPAIHNKGAAIRRIIEEPPFAGRVPVFVGDDVTDEDGFRVVEELQGVSIKVGDVTNSAAKFALPNVAAVRPWLRSAILGACIDKKNGRE